MQIADTIPVDDIWILDVFIGKGLDTASKESMHATQMVARLEDVLLNPRVSGKAMAGLIHLIESDAFRKGQTIIFLNTGGQQS